MYYQINNVKVTEGYHFYHLSIYLSGLHEEKKKKKKRRAVCAHNGRELTNFSANFFNYLSYIVDGFLGYETGLHYC